MALTLALSRREREPEDRLLNSSLSLWERVGVREIIGLTPPIVARSEPLVHFRKEKGSRLLLTHLLPPFATAKLKDEPRADLTPNPNLINAATDDDGSTALMFAANEGQAEATRLLIEKGADVNARRKDGHTPLVAAVAGGGKLEVIKVLVENGADCNAAGAFGVSALRMAELGGQTEVVEYLKSCGAQ